MLWARRLPMAFQRTLQRHLRDCCAPTQGRRTHHSYDSPDHTPRPALMPLFTSKRSIHSPPILLITLHSVPHRRPSTFCSQRTPWVSDWLRELKRPGWIAAFIKQWPPSAYSQRRMNIPGAAADRHRSQREAHAKQNVRKAANSVAGTSADDFQKLADTPSKTACLLKRNEDVGRHLCTGRRLVWSSGGDTHMPPTSELSKGVRCSVITFARRYGACTLQRSCFRSTSEKR